MTTETTLYLSEKYIFKNGIFDIIVRGIPPGTDRTCELKTIEYVEENGTYIVTSSVGKREILQQNTKYIYDGGSYSLALVRTHLCKTYVYKNGEFNILLYRLPEDLDEEYVKKNVAAIEPSGIVPIVHNQLTLNTKLRYEFKDGIFYKLLLNDDETWTSKRVCSEYNKRDSNQIKTIEYKENTDIYIITSANGYYTILHGGKEYLFISGCVVQNI